MMDAIEFLNEGTRMCNIYEACVGCPMCPTDDCCMVKMNLKQMISIVEQWVKEHPVKTRQSEFLKMFPHPRLDRNGCLMICPMDAVGKEYMRDDIPGCINSELDICCEDCCRDFWLKEIE